ncbi:MAG: hypothetical protein GY711_29605 [bacterium]|nr:hypothetical protein [bacterium]
MLSRIAHTLLATLATASVSAALPQVGCYDQLTAFRDACVGALTVETFQGFTTDTPFDTPGGLVVGVGELEAIQPTEARNFIDVAPFAFPENNATTHAAGFVTAAGTEIEVRLAPANAQGFGCTLSGAVDEEIVELAVFDGANRLVAVCAVAGNGVDQFVGYVAATGTLAKARLRSAALVPGGGEGFGLDALVTCTPSAGPIGETPHLCNPAPPNSSGASAHLSAFGSSLAADRNVTITAHDLPPGQFGYLIVSRGLGFIPFPGHAPNLCLLPDVGRYNQNLGQGPTFSTDVGSIPVPIGPLPYEFVRGSDTLYWQCWHRDVGGTSEFSNVRAITFGGDPGCPTTPTTLEARALGTDASYVTVTPDESLAIVQASGADAVTVYDLLDGSHLATFPGTSTPTAVRGIATTNGRAIVVGSAGPDAVRIFDLNARPPRLIASHALFTDAHDVDTVFVSTLGVKAIVRAGAGRDAVTFYDMASGARIASFPAASTPQGVRSVGIGHGHAVAVGAGGDAVMTFELTASSAALTGVHALSSPAHDVATVGASAVVRAAGSGADAITVYQMHSGDRTGTFPAASGASGRRSIATFFTARAIVGGAAGPDAVQVLDPNWPTPRVVATHPLSSDAYDVATSPETGTAVVRAASGTEAVTFYELVLGTRTGAFFSATDGSGSHAAAVTEDFAVATGAAGIDALQIFDLRGEAPVRASIVPLDSDALDVDLNDHPVCAQVGVRRANGTAFFAASGGAPHGTIQGAAATGAGRSLSLARSRAITTGAAGPLTVQLLDLTQ